MKPISLSPHTWKSTKIHSDGCSSWLAEIFCQKIYICVCVCVCAHAWLHVFLIHPKSHIYEHSHTPTPWSSFSELSEVLSPGLQSSFSPKSNLTCNSESMVFTWSLLPVKPKQPSDCRETYKYCFIINIYVVLFKIKHKYSTVTDCTSVLWWASQVAQW